MKIKRLISKLCLFAIMLTVSACGNGNDNPEDDVYPYDGDFLCGYFLTFEDKNNSEWTSPSSNDFTSGNAVSKYICKNKKDGTVSVKSGILTTIGQADIQGSPLSANESGSVIIENETVYFDEGLIGKTVNVNFVYYSAERDEYYTQFNSSYVLSNKDSVVVVLLDDMYAKAKTADGRYEDIQYHFNLPLEIKCSNRIKEIRFAEFNAEHNIIERTIVPPSGLLSKVVYEYTTLKDCDELGLGMTYVVVQDYSETDFANEYTYGSEYEVGWRLKNTQTADELSGYFYFSYGNGLMRPIFLQITFPKD